MEDARLHIFLQNCQGDEDMADVALLKKWVDECDNIVFFGGFGVSTESGIPISKCRRAL